MKLTYFYSSEIKESAILQKEISSLSPLCDLNVKYIDSYSKEFNQFEFLLACHRDDIVIVDCTIPQNKDERSVYPILVAQVNMLDHVIVVSSNMLPLNITPQR